MFIPVNKKKEAGRFLDQIARAESEQDPQKRVKVAHDLLRGMRGPQEKLAFVAIDDDPRRGSSTRLRQCGRRQPT